VTPALPTPLHEARTGAALHLADAVVMLLDSEDADLAAAAAHLCAEVKRRRDGGDRPLDVAGMLAVADRRAVRVVKKGDRKHRGARSCP